MATERANDFEDILPECLKDFRKNLLDIWNKQDLQKREEVLKDVETCKDWLQKWSWEDFYWASKATEDSISKLNLKKANSILADLVKRTSKKCGEIVSWKKLFVTCGNQGWAVLNGSVEGTKGNARIESIYAGGNNIQKLHIRVLVK